MTTEQTINPVDSNQTESGKQALQADTQSDIINQHFGSGGGSLTSISDSLRVNEFSGTGSFSFPFNLSQARGVNPELILGYASGSGHSPYGLGMNVSMPMITHRTSGTAVPQYNDDDILLYSGSDYLVPALDSSNSPIERNETVKNTSYKVKAYRPRSQGNIKRIERLRNSAEGREDDTFWRVITTDNRTLIFGFDSKGRIADPNDDKRIFSWLLQEVIDAKGNHQRLYYASENNNDGMTASSTPEVGHTQAVNLYIDKIKYGNRSHPSSTPYLFMDEEPNVDWMFEAAFDYGQYNLSLSNANPEAVPANKYWAMRKDKYSNYKSGFEIRTRRLCHNVLLFHSFPETANGSAVQRLVKRWHLEYQQTESVSLLKAITEMGMVYQGDDADQPYRAETMPPVELDYQEFTQASGDFNSIELTGGSQQLQGLQQGRYQLADLFQEGIPCAVYRDSKWMYFRKPQQVERVDGQYQLTYGPLQRMPELPAKGGMVNSYRLTNLTAQGHVELVKTEPGKAGYFSSSAGGQWQNFIPFDAFPTEFNHPQAKFADITGEGGSDLVLIGPKSVRFYSNKFTKGFSAPTEITELPSGFPTSLQGGGTASIGFSDMLGTGQAHLFRITHNKVEVWPNLGHGRFGDVIEMANPPQIAAEGFTPSALFLADLDGSGTNDIIYVDGKKAHIYLNQSGNSFADRFTLELPDSLDSVNQLSFADIYGIGSASLVLTVTHPEVQHFIYDFSQGNKPYLLNRVNNNKGYNADVSYTSSAHEYLDDERNGQSWRSQLPLAIQVVKQLTHTDEINQLSLAQTYSYSDGFYDYNEREYRGFGRVEKRELEVSLSDSNLEPSAPLCMINWYHTGAPTMDDTYDDAGDTRLIRRQDYYQFDQDIADISATLLDEDDLTGAQNIEEFERNAHRALRGRLLRNEVYGIENGQRKSVPFSAQETRYRVKHIQSLPAGFDVVQPRALETINYHYDEVADDPKINHQITRSYDDFGFVTDSVSFAYPRLSAISAYYQQSHQDLWALRTEQTYINENIIGGAHLLGLANQNTKTHLQEISVPGGRRILNHELLTQDYIDSAVTVLVSLSRQIYVDAEQNRELPQGQVTPQALVSHTETAVLDKEQLSTLLITEDDIFPSSTELAQLLQQEGGFTSEDDNDYWWQSSERTEYGGADNFYLAIRSIDPFDNTTTIEYDSNSLKVSSVTDALDNTISSEWHYRTLSPSLITDFNDNQKSMQYDGFGRLQRSAYRGFEQGEQAGFILSTNDSDNALQASSLLTNPVTAVGDSAQVEVIADKAWMGQISADDLSSHSEISSTAATEIMTQLVTAMWLTVDGYIRQAARQQIHPTEDFALPLDDDIFDSQKSVVRSVLRAAMQQPVHKVIVSAEEYAEGRTGTAKVRSAIVHQDGFARMLQQKAKVEDGEAFTIDDEGELELTDGKPVKAETSNRWLTSGRTLYNNKGLAVQQFEPYYLNTADFIEHEELRQFGVSKIVSYDALGRAVKTLSAKGLMALTEYYPWYQRHFDENDTLLDSPYYQANLVDAGQPDSPYFDEDLFIYRDLADADFMDASDVKGQRAVDESSALRQSLVQIGTPTTQVSDGLNNVIVKEKLDYAKVDRAVFEDTGLDNSTLDALIGHLQDINIVTSASTLSIDFDGLLPQLPEEFDGQRESILMALRELHEDRQQITKQSFDILGRVTSIQDARITTRANIINTYNLALKVKSDSVDSGSSWLIPNALGAPIFQQDARSKVLRFSYDELNRHTHLYEKDGDDLLLREQFVYLDTKDFENDDEALVEAQESNLISRMRYLYDQSGLTELTEINLNGAMLEQTIRYAAEFKTAIDWPVDMADKFALLQTTEYMQQNSFNARGEVLSEVDAIGNTRSYEYYVSGQLSAVKHLRDGGTEQTLVSEIEYAPNGQVLSENHSGVLSKYQYERTTLRLQRTISTRTDDNKVLRDQRYTYDPVGNVTTIREASNLSEFTHSNSTEPVQRYIYDGLYRLIEAKGRKQAGAYSATDLPSDLRLGSSNPHTLESYTQSFSYDKGNNLTQKRLMADVNNTQNFTIDSQSNRSKLASSSASIDSLFDNAGNLLSRTGSSQQDMFWDFKRQLSKVVLLERSGDEDDAEYYVYNSAGNRVRKITESYTSNLNNVDVEEVLYLAGVEIRTRGQRTAAQQHAQRDISSELHISKLPAGKASESRLLSWQSGRPSEQLNHQYRTTLSNHQNSANIEISQQAELISFEEYYAFGETAVHATRNQSEVKLKHYRYSGKERDSATGLYYYGMRYYAPWLNRWLNPDPAGLVDGLNVYAFVQNNPATYKDPNGLDSESDSTSDDRETQEVTISFEDDGDSDDESLESIAEQADESDDESSEDEQEVAEEEESPIEQAKNAIRDIVSLYLNVNDDNKFATKDAVLKQYANLKAIAKEISAEELGEAFKAVGQEILDARDEVKANFDQKDKSNHKTNRKHLAEAFDRQRADRNSNSSSGGGDLSLFSSSTATAPTSTVSQTTSPAANTTTLPQSSEPLRRSQSVTGNSSSSLGLSRSLSLPAGTEDIVVNIGQQGLEALATASPANNTDVPETPPELADFEVPIVSAGFVSELIAVFENLSRGVNN